MIRRQQNDKFPWLEQDPQRDFVSRIDIRFILHSSWEAMSWARGVMMSLVYFFSQSTILLCRCSLFPDVIISDPINWTPFFKSGRCRMVMRCPIRAKDWPSVSVILGDNPFILSTIQSIFSLNSDSASASDARGGSVIIASPVSWSTRNMMRFALAFYLRRRGILWPL